MAAIETYLIDNCKIFREGLKRLLPEEEFAICGEADSLDRAMAEWGNTCPAGLVLAEYPDESPDPLAQLELRDHEGHAPKVVVFAARMNCDWLRRALAGGADGFLLKDTSSDTLVASLRLVLAGAKVMPTDLADYLVSGQGLGGDESAINRDLNALSNRERHVLQGLVLGQSNKLIARNLQIAEGTVKVHLKGVLKKLHLSNRTQAAIWALNNGLIPAREANQP